MNPVDQRRNELIAAVESSWPKVPMAHRSKSDEIGAFTIEHAPDGATIKLGELKLKTVRTASGRELFEVLDAERERLRAASTALWPKVQRALSKKVDGWKALVASDASFGKQKDALLYALVSVRSGRFGRELLLSTAPPSLNQQHDAYFLPRAGSPGNPDRVYTVVLVAGEGRASGSYDPLLASAARREVITIEYGVVRVPKVGGWHPTYWENGRPHYFFVPKGYDRDQARVAARNIAEDRAARYVGDWDVKLVEIDKDIAWEDRLRPRDTGRASGRSTKLRDAQKRLARQWQGLSRHRALKEFPRRSIERGADVEIEHVGYRPIARRIAADHLMEDRRYYQKLAKMEGHASGRSSDVWDAGYEAASKHRDRPNMNVADAFILAMKTDGRVPRIRESDPGFQQVYGEFSEGFLSFAAGRAGGRKPKGTPTHLNLFTLHKELQNHARMFGRAEPLYRFESVSINGIRRLVDAGYLVPAEGYPRGHWAMSPVGRLEYEKWRMHNAGHYGIETPSNEA